MHMNTHIHVNTCTCAHTGLTGVHGLHRGPWAPHESAGWRVPSWLTCPLPFPPSPQTAQTVLAVVVVFGVSWLPHHVVHLWAEFGVFPLTPASFLLRVAAHCLAYSNSSVNPIIYAFLSDNFRKAYRQVFRCDARGDSPRGGAREPRSRADTPPSTNCTQV